MTTTNWISKKPGRCGGSACVRDTRIPIWILVEQRRQGQTDEKILLGLPQLTADDLVIAWEYAATNSEEIDRALWENEACMVDHSDRPVPVELVFRGRQLGLTDEQIRQAFFPPLSLEALHEALMGSEKV